jgi:predicted nucleic acid-binding protein
MTVLIDTSLWIDFTRARSPASLKQFIAPFILDPEAHLAEPVRFEMLRSARPDETRQLTAQFATLPLLSTPVDLWEQAIELGQACRQIGQTVLSLDLLVAVVALHHNALLVSFDADFETIAAVSDLRLQRLERPA